MLAEVRMRGVRCEGMELSECVCVFVIAFESIGTGMEWNRIVYVHHALPFLDRRVQPFVLIE